MRAKLRTKRAVAPKLNEREVVGLSHPLMTPELAAALLPNGFRIPLDLGRKIGLLLSHLLRPDFDPNALAIGVPRSLGQALDESLDQELRSVQAANLKRTGKARPNTL